MIGDEDLRSAWLQVVQKSASFQEENPGGFTRSAPKKKGVEPPLPLGLRGI
jgi:hypothetical protein